VVSRYVMKAIADPRIRLYLVWGPMEREDTEADARKATVNLPDPRAVHFWTDDDVLAEAWARSLGVVDDEAAYDTYMIFPPGAVWEEDGPPEPPYFMWIEKTGLPKETKFNGVVFAEQVRRFLGLAPDGLSPPPPAAPAADARPLATPPPPPNATTTPPGGTP
jgi:hypothetical protein